ncbi:male-specific lethal 1-like 1 isoform X2 [Lineus longissimus]|uniref:male-specific lethal 1-like 1 isoform X2 n=1 Tax=Lineus longissimus TaxID=88925 RepID=UPI002B4F8365
MNKESNGQTSLQVVRAESSGLIETVVDKFCKMTNVLLPNCLKSPFKMIPESYWYGQLKCRLERMERRMSLLKQKGDGVDAPLPSDIPGVTSERTLHLPVQAMRTPEKSIRRRHGEQRTPNRRNLNTPNKDQGTPGKNRNKARVNNLLSNRVKKRTETAEKGLASPSGIELRSKQPEASPVKIDKYDPNVNLPAPSRVEFRLKPVKRKLEEVGEIVKTDKTFYVPCVDYKALEVVAKVPESPNRKKRARVEVPKWRFHPVSNCYALEGTENMEDEIYLKRHQKSENDEKRRKRWDIQRMREQRMYEKLKSGRYGASSPPKSKKNEMVTTFCPILDEAKFLEITGDIPVNVFGYPLPYKKKNEFSLPWFDIAKREKEEDRKEKEEKQKQQQSRFRKR